jgi:hypothetical protein
MRTLLVLAALAACTSEPRAPVVVRDARVPTFEVTFLDRIDDMPATHVAVGGRTRVHIPDGPATFTAVAGPFSITSASHDTLVITALDRGVGHVEIETTTGFARFRVSAAPIAKLAVVSDSSDRSRRIALLDDANQRLVDTNLRLAGGSAPVSFAAAWDRIELGSLPPGAHDIFVQTDVLAPTQLRITR